MSIYRSFKRSPRSDVHHVAEHVSKPAETDTAAPLAPAPQKDWTKLRKGQPADTLFPSSVRWMESLPVDVRPKALAASFPRIVNMLARLWSGAAAFSEYLSELQVDRRGGRKGFPLDVLKELHTLREYYGTLNPDQIAVWDDPSQPR
jgi:hypothetical protein